MRRIGPAMSAVGGMLAGTLASTIPAIGQEPAAFYQGKTISIVMGTGPGGSYDLYGRVIAAHLARHIPGNPNIVIEHMPGAGGATAGNFIYGPAPQDGTKILLSHALPLIEKLEGGPGIRFESGKLQWLGSYDQIVQVMAIWHTAKVNDIEDLTTKDLVVGSMGTSHLTHQWATLLKNTLGASYRVISGYSSGNDLNLAMERGEIHGWTISWENLVGAKPNWLPERQVIIPVQFSLERTPELPNVPTLLELSNGEKREVAEFLLAGTPLARAMAVGPGVPADRVAALRTAFVATIKDAAFLQEAAKRKLSIHLRTSEQVSALVDKIVSASPELVARVKKAVGQAQ